MRSHPNMRPARHWGLTSPEVAPSTLWSPVLLAGAARPSQHGAAVCTSCELGSPKYSRRAGTIEVTLFAGKIDGGAGSYASVRKLSNIFYWRTVSYRTPSSRAKLRSLHRSVRRPTHWPLFQRPAFLPPAAINQRHRRQSRRRPRH